MCWLKSRFKSLWQKIMLNIISVAIIRACSGSCHSTWLVPVTHSGLALPGLGRLLTAEWLRLEDTAGDGHAQRLLKARAAKAGCSRLWPAGF